MTLARHLLFAALQAAACVFSAGAMAQVANPFDESVLRGYVSQQVAGNAGDQLTRFDIRLGSLEPSSALALCRRSEPFTPAGARFWGRSSLGVRCVEGANWSVLVPLTVTAWGRAIVAASPLAAGAILMPQDLREQEVELTREPAPLVRDMNLLAGRTLTRAVNAGQGMRLDMVRVTSVMQAGDAVRLRVAGAGFTIAASGQALGAAGIGQSVRVKTELGRVVTGIAREDRVVDLVF